TALALPVRLRLRLLFAALAFTALALAGLVGLEVGEVVAALQRGGLEWISVRLRRRQRAERCGGNRGAEQFEGDLATAVHGRLLSGVGVSRPDSIRAWRPRARV